jgi:DNA-binding MarR family transcriptional regulator
MNVGNRGVGLEGFRMLPDVMLFDPEVKDTDLRTWAVLCFFARSCMHTSATNASLAEAMGVSLATLKRSLARLESAGFIYAEHTGPERTLFLVPRGKGEAVFTLKVVAG